MNSPGEDASCHGSKVDGGLRGSMVLLRLHTLRWRLRHDGVLRTLKRVASGLARPISPARAKVVATGPLQKASPSQNESDLQPAEWVEIRSVAEIQGTLDASGRCRGLGMMPEMWQFCGTRARVLKRVNSIVVESPNGSEVQAVRKMRHTVLLEGLHCDGQRLRCDRACFFFWRECWLRRVPGPSVNPLAGGQNLDV